MCFVLYAGTSQPIPLRDWRDDAPDISVKPLTEREAPITVNFSKPHVQYIGSTSQCGCDFPHAMYQNGEWPWYEEEEEDDSDRQRKASEQYNRDSLVALLRNTFESTVELYGVWDGNFDFASPPLNCEAISLDALLSRDFRFKEQGFYLIRLTEIDP